MLAVGTMQLPERWAKPVVKAIILPTHAQTSPINPSTIPPQVPDIDPPELVPPHFHLELAGPFTGQQLSLSQNGLTGVLTLRPGVQVPPELCQQNFAFVGSGYTVSITGDRPVGDINFTLTGKAENWAPALTECSGVEMQALVDGPQNGCYATDDPLPYTVPLGSTSIDYLGYAPIVYNVKPCLQGCANVSDGLAGNITISDNDGVIPTLTIAVVMQGSCI